MESLPLEIFEIVLQYTHGNDLNNFYICSNSRWTDRAKEHLQEEQWSMFKKRSRLLDNLVIWWNKIYFSFADPLLGMGCIFFLLLLILIIILYVLCQLLMLNGEASGLCIFIHIYITGVLFLAKQEDICNEEKSFNRHFRTIADSLECGMKDYRDEMDDQYRLQKFMYDLNGFITL